MPYLWKWGTLYSTFFLRKPDMKYVHLLLQWYGFTSHIQYWHVPVWSACLSCPSLFLWAQVPLFLHTGALCTGASAHTHMCLTLHQEDKNRPSLHAPRGHEVAYGLLMSPHINLRFNSESPKRRDATTSDLRGGTLHCINSPWTGLHPRCHPFLHYY